MTPEKFISLWKGNSLTERAGAQAHFLDLCDMLGVDKPRDPHSYCFERGAKKKADPDGSAGDGWVDVWKRGHFGWENKKPGRDLNKAFRQLTDYADNLESPSLLVVSDRERVIIHTHFREKLESDPDFRREGCGLPDKSLDYANAIEPITRRPHEHTLRN